ncbi:MAG TPA: sulfur carrier protein ThiS [Capsulimonadaceae bacterium]|nr:sulfur carrier protein ThiS [Capsulimonadaceae bacterium]
MMCLTINGDEREIEQAVTIAQFLAAHNLHERMVVVEHNGEIIPRQKYAEVMLQEGDKLEIVQMMAGG